MKKIAWSVAAATLLSACSTAPQHVLAPEVVSHDSINPVQAESGSYIGSVWFRKPWTKVEQSQLQQCMQTSVEHRRITVAPLELAGEIDAANTGSQPVSEENSQGSTVMTGVAKGSQPPVAFRLKLQLGSTSNYYYFDRIGRASGGEAFSPVGAWDTAAPMQTWQVLQQTADDIQSCLYRHASNSPSPDNDIVEHQPPLDATSDLNLPINNGSVNSTDDISPGGLGSEPGRNGNDRMDEPLAP
ncbi:hypothetical protein C7446_1217 [Kushneria sinocarnis]|uniref:Lipoprotein n=1 Tax=Kushneria sinocarnis TaxID=595502 RepID=A0A420WYL5_9GAMM|nr:hypothetical protein C7446_1217 [Kushneria sinocarnis]